MVRGEILENYLVLFCNADILHVENSPISQPDHDRLFLTFEREKHLISDGLRRSCESDIYIDLAGNHQVATRVAVNALLINLAAMIRKFYLSQEILYVFPFIN